MTKKMLIVFIFILLLFNVTKVKAAGETTEYMGVYGATVKYVPVGEFMEDSTYSNYYSQKYIIYIEKLEIEDFNISILSEVPEGTYIANTDGKKQNSFKSFDRQFKIMIPKDKLDEEFILKVKVLLNFVTYTARYNSEGEIIATGVTASNSQILTIDNRKSKLNIKCVDDLTNEEIKGVTLNVKDDTFNVSEKYTSNKKGEIKVKKIGRGSATITIDSVPKGYYIDDEEYKVEIQKNSKEEYILRLTPKTGEIRISNNAIGSEFEIYDEDGKLIQILKNETGIIVIRNLRFGNYALVQKNITGNFKEIEKITFAISSKIVKELTVENEEKVIVVIPPYTDNKVDSKPEDKPGDKIEEEPGDKTEEKVDKEPENNNGISNQKPSEVIVEKPEIKEENIKEEKKEETSENKVQTAIKTEEKKDIPKVNATVVSKTNIDKKEEIETKNTEYLELDEEENDETIKFDIVKEEISSDSNKEKLNKNEEEENKKIKISPMIFILIILLIIVLIIWNKKRKQTDKQSTFRN